MSLEKFRLGLIKWNVAPLCVVAFLCWVVWTLVEFYKDTQSTIDATSQGALFIFLAGAIGILYKMYDSMQRDRAKQPKEEDKVE
jgi:peptidoglycan/LPS O-acetylase OafA/YrhL